jgi:excisionase family DNA binding protein
MNAASEEIEQIMAQPVATVDEAAKVLRIGRSMAYNAVKSGDIRSIKIGRRLLVPTAAIRELLTQGSDAA